MISRFFPLKREFLSVFASAIVEFLCKSNRYVNRRGIQTGIYFGPNREILRVNRELQHGFQWPSHFCKLA